MDESLNPQYGLFSQYYLTLVGMGLFQKLVVFQDEAKKLGIDLSEMPTDVISRASDILRTAHISDEHAIEVLDIAGSLLRERKLFTLKKPVVSIDDAPGHAPTVFLTLPLRVTPEVAVDMTFELYERLLKKFPDYSSSLNVGFRSALMQ